MVFKYFMKYFILTHNSTDLHTRFGFLGLILFATFIYMVFKWLYDIILTKFFFSHYYIIALSL